MGRYGLVLLAAVVTCAVAPAASSASAHVRPAPIFFTVQNIGDGSASCPNAFFGLSFDMVSLGGATLATGVSCVMAFDGCQLAGCHDTVGATFTLDFGRGSLTLAAVLHEFWLSDSLVLQSTDGRITSGTGIFTGATGVLHWGGTVRFTETGVIPHLVGALLFT